jgi:hypothetical protein
MIGNTPWTLKATTAANAQAAYSTNRARAQAAHDAALLSAMNDWQTSNRSSTLSLLVAEGQSREAYNKATATVYANWELGIGNLLGDKPAGTGWEIDESHDEKNKRYFGGHHNVGTVGLASGINRGFDEGSDPRVPVPSVGRGTDGRGSMLPPLPDARSVVSQRSFQPTSEENLRLHPNTVAFLRDHPEFAKAFYEREGFTHLQRLNTVLSYGWTVNLADWFWGRDRYYSHTSELEIWIDTDMSIADQTDALVELIDDIYLKKKIPLDTHNVLSAFESPGFLDPSKPRNQAFIQAQYHSAEFGRGVATDIALEAVGMPFLVLSKGDDVYKILTKLDEVAPGVSWFKSTSSIRAFLKTKCFARDTLVSSETGLRPIGEIQVGERVHSYDFQSGIWKLGTVTDRIDSLYEGPVVTVETNTAKIEATIHHPSWVVSGHELEFRPICRGFDRDQDRQLSLTGRWVNSHDLLVGDVIVSKTQERCTIQRISQRYENAFPVSNLTIDQFHNYSVGPVGILVHNDAICEAGEAWLLNLILKKQASIDEIAEFTKGFENGSEVLMRLSNRKYVLGLTRHLDEFSKTYKAYHYERFAADDMENWQSRFYDIMNHDNADVFFNLKNVNVWEGVARASTMTKGKYGPTDWELLQIKMNPNWWPRIKWIDEYGKEVPNPFLTP